MKIKDKFKSVKITKYCMNMLGKKNRTCFKFDYVIELND